MSFVMLNDHEINVGVQKMEKAFRVNICGVELLFSSGESDEVTERIVEKVRQTIKQTMDASEVANVTKASMLSCMSICADAFSAQAEQEQLRQRTLEAEKRAALAEQEKIETQKENEQLRSALINLKIELSNSKDR